MVVRQYSMRPLVCNSPSLVSRAASRSRSAPAFNSCHSPTEMTCSTRRSTRWLEAYTCMGQEKGRDTNSFAYKRKETNSFAFEKASAQRIEHTTGKQGPTWQAKALNRWPMPGLIGPVLERKTQQALTHLYHDANKSCKNARVLEVGEISTARQRSACN